MTILEGLHPPVEGTNSFPHIDQSLPSVDNSQGGEVPPLPLLLHLPTVTLHQLSVIHLPLPILILFHRPTMVSDLVVLEVREVRVEEVETREGTPEMVRVGVVVVEAT